MAAADKIMKALKAVAGEAKAIGKVGVDTAKRSSRAASGGYKGARAAGKSVAGSTADAISGAAKGIGRQYRNASAADKGRMSGLGVASAGLAGMGVGGALEALGMMSGGDEAEMAEMAERSGLPLGGNSMASMRMAMLPSIQKKISSEVLSGRDPSRILSRIERDIYEPLARQTNEMGEGEADDLYNLTEGMARVLYADAPEQDKLAALYELAGME